MYINLEEWSTLVGALFLVTSVSGSAYYCGWTCVKRFRQRTTGNFKEPRRTGESPAA